MRTIWHSDSRGGRLLRLIFVIAGFFVSFFAIDHALVIAMAGIFLVYLLLRVTRQK